MVDSLTVRHSATVGPFGEIKTGTVAQIIIGEGLDNYVSPMMPDVKFFFGRDPYYFNHPKDKELKDREISIAEAKARLNLNRAEAVTKDYGTYTGIDMLGRSDKDTSFYRQSARALSEGGAIQASDASRYSPMMSAVAVAICIHGLGCLTGSSHLTHAAWSRMRHYEYTSNIL